MRRVVLILTLGLGLAAALVAASGCSSSSEHESPPKPGPSPAQVSACETHCDSLAAGQRHECDRGVIEADKCKRALELALEDCKRICKPRE